MSSLREWGFVPLMFGAAVLGAVIATAVMRQHEQVELHKQRAHYELDAAKKHMTTIIQLQDCYLNEAFYSLDREIFLTKQQFERTDIPQSLQEEYRTALKWITSYYRRFGLTAECDDCVPRSAVPQFGCQPA